MNAAEKLSLTKPAKMCILSELTQFVFRASEDPPYITEFFLEDGAAGKTAIDAIIVVDGVTDAVVSGSD